MLVLIVGVAVAIAFASYLYSSQNSELLWQNEIRDIDRTARIEAGNINKIVENKIGDIRNNLVLISNTNRVQLLDVSSAAPAFTIGQESTKDFTDSYFWVDKDGKLLWASSFVDEANYQQYVSGDRSDRSYYTVPKTTHSFHISSVFESVDGIPRIYFSYPVLSDEGDRAGAFQGVVVASANPLAVGQYLKSQLSPETSNTVGLMTRDATILYSDDEELIGLNYFGEEFQSQLPDGLKQDFNDVIGRSLLSTSMGQESLSYEGSSGSITSVPVTVDGASFGILYLVAPYTLANEAQQILDSQTTFTIFFIGALTAVAIAAALSVLKWNRSLYKLVKSRTAELEDSNRSLAKALEDLTVHDKMQKEFINIAAHELRTPIQPILSMAEIAEADNISETGAMGKEVIMQREDFEMILRNARRLERLSSDILEVARIESKALRLHKETFDLNEKIQRVVCDMKSGPPDGRNVDIVFEPAGKPILIHADKSKVYEVISNLVGNAVKFTPHNGRVSITVRDQEELIISVKDTGPGVDPEIMPNLFTKFVTKSFTGTGLGLYISKAIVEAHGGRIWAENNSNGSTGATFSFTLPAAREGSQGELLATERKMI